MVQPLRHAPSQLLGLWLHGKKAVNQIDSNLVDSLVQLVDFEQVQLQREQGKYLLSSKRPGLQLDFSAIAKGYAVELLDSELVRVVSPNGYESTMRLKRLPSLARYCATSHKRRVD